MAAKREPPADAERRWDTHVSRAMLLTGVWASFLIGALLAGVATGNLQEWTRLPAAGALMAAAAIAAKPAGEK